MNVCPGPADHLGAVRGVLASVDCQVQTYAKAGYLALTGPASFFPAALTSLLVIYVALIGFRLIFGIGQQRLADAPILALKLGMVLAVALNWASFQTLVFNLAADAPMDVAQVLGGPLRGGASHLAADPVTGLQTLYDELASDAAAFGKNAGPNPLVLQGGDAAAAQKLWNAQNTLFLSTAGLLAVAMIAVGILATVGPVFIALALLAETSGLFFGWLRALVGAALVPLLGWTTTLILLVTVEPWVDDLAAGRAAGSLNSDMADTVCLMINVFAAAQAALVVGALVIASGLSLRRGAGGPAATPQPTPLPAAHTSTLSRPAQLALALGRAGGAGRISSHTTTSSTPGLATATSSAGAAAGSRLGDAYRRNAHLKSGGGYPARKAPTRNGQEKL